MGTNSVSRGDTEQDREVGLDTHRTAKILGVATITLAQWRARGEGPRFYRCGRLVRYRLGDVLDYREANSVGRKVQP